MVGEAGDLTSLRDPPRSPVPQEAGVFSFSLTPYGRMPRNDSARPELPYCGSTTSAIREGPKLSPGLASGLFLRSARHYARLAANGTSCHPTSAPHAPGQHERGKREIKPKAAHLTSQLLVFGLT